MTSDDARFVTEFIDGFFPITPKVQGVNFDAFVSNADVNALRPRALAAPQKPSRAVAGLAGPCSDHGRWPGLVGAGLADERREPPLLVPDGSPPGSNRRDPQPGPAAHAPASAVARILAGRRRSTHEPPR